MDEGQPVEAVITATHLLCSHICCDRTYCTAGSYHSCTTDGQPMSGLFCAGSCLISSVLSHSDTAGIKARGGWGWTHRCQTGVEQWGRNGR